MWDTCMEAWEHAVHGPCGDPCLRNKRQKEPVRYVAAQQRDMKTLAILTGERLTAVNNFFEISSPTGEKKKVHR